MIDGDLNLKEQFIHWLQVEWYEKKVPHLSLLPLEALFKQAVRLRRHAYRQGLKKSDWLPVPVLIVGNLSVGGTGKTPLVIWLAKFLRGQGYKPGIISRGYGASVGARPVMVTADAKIQQVGDEPILIARRTHCPVCVFPKRVDAARTLLEQTDSNILIADDGLQHYALARDIEIAIVDGQRGFGNGHCLPAGPLREPPERLNSADCVVYSGDGPKDEIIMTLEGSTALNLRNEDWHQPLTAFSDSPLYAMAGIAHPERFFAHLQSHGLRCENRAFPDHHIFKKRDLEWGGNAPLLMTEKDAVKCFSFAASRCWYVPVEAKLPVEFADRMTVLIRSIRK
jgi:tetraacyldisaccharide 4'-kinase